MTQAESLLTEFDAEMASTRKLLERVPEAKSDWKPHEKSKSLGDLATQVANLLSFLPLIAKHDEFDAMNFQRPPKFSTTAKLLELFDEKVKAGREALAGIPDSLMPQTWSLKRGGQTFISRPRAAVIRGLTMSHHIHHRGQLTVYLRMLDVPLPGMYGPTADEM